MNNAEHGQPLQGECVKAKFRFNGRGGLGAALFLICFRADLQEHQFKKRRWSHKRDDIPLAFVPGREKPLALAQGSGSRGSWRGVPRWTQVEMSGARCS
ncbi:hypothetical protein NDU88_004018 [Pleurodeles waltl]|uniref:Uncharacterized protein n=1 Tax=Pleurodeles waltl TaxID=8319 RepID=A0AAV7VHJ2_PLEWA|nr:hypothetical protein NDU88_004018 [Pleurodeles waltl]